MLLAHAVDLHVDRDTGCVFGDEVVEERDAALDRVGHLHAVGEEGQDEVREMDPGPEVERLVQRIAAREPLFDRQPRERELVRIDPGHALGHTRTEELRRMRAGRAKRLDPRRNPAQPLRDDIELRDGRVLGRHQHRRGAVRARLPHFCEQLRDDLGVLAGAVVEEDVAAERRIAREHLV